MDSIQLGPWLFKPADFSISDATQRKELEPLLVKLLCCFATEPGRIISRQELIDSIWQQSYVDDNAINRAISELRKALQHPALPQSPIKTHHRKGYSLQLKVLSTASEQPTPSRETASEGRKSARTFWFTLLIILILIGSAASYYFTANSTDKPAPESESVAGSNRITLEVLSQQKVTWFKGIESRPLVSPDKQLLAYSHSQPDGTIKVQVRKLGGSAGNAMQEVSLSDGDKMHSLQTWQPQSRNLLLQVVNKDGSGCEYQKFDFSNYPNYQLTRLLPCDGMVFGTAQLSVDGQWLYYSKGQGGLYSSNALLAENLTTGSVQTVVAAPTAGFGVTMLAFSADGSKLAYILMPESNKPDVYIYDPASREHRRIASMPQPLLLLGLDWSIDQNSILLPAADAILQLGIDDKQQTIWQLPSGLTVGELSLISDNQAYVSSLTAGSVTQGSMQLIKISQPFSAEQRISFLHNAAGSALSLAVAPKEPNNYAFGANWTGGWQLWLNNNGENVQLTEFENNQQPVNNISWSGNGRYIAFVKQGNLYLYDTQLRQLINKRQQNDVGHPVWLPDSSGLVMTRLDGNSQNLWQLDLVSDNYTQLTFAAGSQPVFDEQGQLYYQRDGNLYQYVDGAKQDIVVQSNDKTNFMPIWQFDRQLQYRFSMLGHIEQTDKINGDVKQTQLPYQLMGVYPNPHDPQQLYAAVFITPELALELIEWEIN